MELNQPAQHSHYVSLDNGSIHPAMTSPTGYEDQHLTEWRPATHAEIEAYKAGTLTTVNVAPVALVAGTNPAISPTTLQLAPEDANGAEPFGGFPAPVPLTPVGELPPITSAPAPAPAPAPVTPAPVAPAPAIPPAAQTE